MIALIVDDNPLNLKLLRSILESEDIIVFTASDGMEALEFLGREEVDIIISDILMPKMDGYQLCIEVRKHPVLKRIPFIHYTATYTSRADEKLSWSVGANLFFRKPEQGRELFAAIKRLGQEGTAWLPNPERPLPETIVLKQYNAALVQKLEERNLDLSSKVEALERAQNELAIAKQKAEEISLFREMLCVHMNDEVRMPLERLMMITNLLSSSTRDDQTKNYADNIRNGATRVMTMLSSVMSLARGQSSPEQGQALDLVKGVKAMLDTYSRSYETLGHKIVPNLPQSTILVNVNREYLSHVIDMLLKSASKFTNSGTIFVELNSIAAETGPWAVVSISDYGADLTKEFAAYLFERPVDTASAGRPSIDLDHTTGLTVTRHLAQLMGGKLIVEAKVGAGSKYHLSLPISEAQAATGGAPVQVSPVRASR